MELHPGKRSSPPLEAPIPLPGSPFWGQRENTGMSKDIKKNFGKFSLGSIGMFGMFLEVLGSLNTSKKLLQVWIQSSKLGYLGYSWKFPATRSLWKSSGAPKTSELSWKISQCQGKPPGKAGNPRDLTGKNKFNFPPWDGQSSQNSGL